MGPSWTMLGDSGSDHGEFPLQKPMEKHTLNSETHHLGMVKPMDLWLMMVKPMAFFLATPIINSDSCLYFRFRRIRSCSCWYEPSKGGSWERLTDSPRGP